MRRYDVDRRLFLGASAVTLLGAAGAARAQAPQAAKAGEAAAGTKPTARVADFIAGFELKHAPALAIERARTAFIDTVGVMLAGSRSEPAGIVLELVRAEGAKPAVSIVGQSLRASPQLAALANGVASHALDFDFTYMQGQLVAPIIPALLPLAESTGATPAQTLAAFIVGFEVASRLSRANPNHNGGGAWHATGTIGTIGAAAACARLLEPAGRDPSRRARHQRVDGRGRQRQLRHHDQAAACGAGRAQRNSGGAARRARLHRQPGGDRRPRRVRAHFRARAGMAARRVRRSRHVIRSGGARISAQALSVRRRDPHRHRRRAQAARGAGAARGRHLRHQGGHLEIRRQSRERAVSRQHRSSEVQSAICRRLCARERAADAVGLRRGRDQGRAGEGAGAHGVGRDRCRIRRRARGLSHQARGDPRRRAHARAAVGLCQRHPAISDVAGADRGQVPGLRRAGDRARRREADSGDAARARRAGQLRRILAVAATGADRGCSRDTRIFQESNRRPRDVARPAFVCSASREGRRSAVS